MAKKQEYTSKFTADEIDSRLEAVSDKFGAVYIDASTMTFYYFKNQEDKQKFLDGDTSVVLDSERFDTSNKIQQMKIINDMGSAILYFTTQEEKSVITVGFLSQEKDFGDEEYTEVYENAFFTVDVDKSNTGSWVTIVESQRVINGEKFSVDVKGYLATGQNKVRIRCTGEQSEKSATLLFTANVTTMYLKASDFGWHLPYIEGNPFRLGGMLIGGSIDKVLNIRISNENNYAATYKVALGTATHTINPYSYDDLPFPTEGGTGIYHVDLWIDANGLESDHIRYNIMCVAAADQYTAQLIVINSSLSKVVNYAENTVFEYSCYNAGGTTATPHLKLQSIIGTVPTVLVEGSLGTVETAKAHSYTYQPEIESWEDGMQLQAILTSGNEQTIVYPIDNSLSFPAISGASFYLQPSSRNNTQDDRETVINQADHSYWQTYWENMAWKDGIDGWTTDAAGKKCLFLPAGSTAEMQFQPMKALTNKTIDLVFKVDNIADYDTPVFSICDDPESDTFNGIKIFPDRVVVYTNDQKSSLVQSREFREGVRQSVQIVYANNYKGIGNIVTIYQNGVAQCEFQYETKDLVTNSGYIRMGNPSSDFYLYSMRVYEKALAWPDAVQNWIASLDTTDEKQAAMDFIMKCVDDSFDMSFDAVVASGLDYMTIEMTEGKIPSYVSQSEGRCNVELKVKGWWDTVTKFLDIPIEGQGSTAINYWLWNLRLKLSTLEFFAGKWTGKINFASGMQNHKMGATYAYNELYHAIGLVNEVEGPVAVEQRPVFAFEKKLVDASAGLYSYEFVGLYTFGPDKGNDAYFRFDDERFADNVIYLEGMDHNVKGAGYDYPYDRMSYKASAEALCNNGGEAALEVRKCGNAETEAEIQAKLDEKFRPLYELAYSNNPLIKGTDVTLEDINADVEAWGKQTDADGHKFERFEFWIDGVYDVLYLDKAEGIYRSNGTNLLTQLSLTEDDLAGLTIEEKNEVFINARVERFKASAEGIIDVRDYMYKMVYCIIFFASDNGIKNTYTYLLEEKWRQLQDDLDSIFKSDNQSLFSKKFWQEMSDFSNENRSAYAFKGEHNVLEQLLLRAFPDVEKEVAHMVLDAMVSLSPYGDNTIEKLMGYMQSRSWDKAQGYFPKSAYNNFTALAYEGAWPAYIGKSTVSYTVDVNPLSQVVGDSLETEMNFMYFRLIYVMSKYAYGPFANYDDKCLGQITWRTQASQSLTLTPAFPLYPAALSGQTGKRNADRRYEAGESITFDGLGGSNTNVYIAAADCLEDVGDLSNIIVDSETDATLQVSAKRLKRLKVGDEVSASSNIGRLLLTSTPALETLDARNLKNLSSDVDLSNSPRLKEALLAGSVSTGVSLKRGQKIQVLSLPATITSLELLDLPNLADENLTLEGVGNVTFLRLENCKGVDMFELLKTVYNTEGNKLTNIRIVGFVYDGTAEDVEMLAHFANDTEADGNERVYNGIDADGKTDTLNIPVIEGTLNLDGYVYEESAEIVRANYPNLVFQPLGYYIAFADAEVLSVLLANGVGDGTGITADQAAEVTSIGTWFKGNTTIETFDELERFTNVNALDIGAFDGCTALTSVNLINITSLAEVYNVFKGTPLAGDVYMPNLVGKIGHVGAGVHGVFQGTKIERVLNLGKATLLASGYNSNFGGQFQKCTSLKSVNLPETLESIGAFSFYNCTQLQTINIPDSVTIIGSCAFYNCPITEVSMLGVQIINASAFVGTSLRGDLFLPSLTTLGTLDYSPGAFKGTKITKVTSLGSLAILPSGYNSNNPGTFGKCLELVEVTLPVTLTKIGAYTFYGCTALEAVIVEAVSPPTLENVNAFTNTNDCPIYVPDGTTTDADGNEITIVDAYKQATNWSAYADRIYPISVYESGGVSNMITFADSAVEAICLANWDTDGNGYMSKNECASVTDMTSTFYANTEITSFDELAQFTNLVSLGTRTDNPSVYGTFNGCTNLKSVTLPSSVTTLGAYAFNNCSSLESVGDLSNIEVCGPNAFVKCSSLAIVVNMPKLGNYAFIATGSGLVGVANLGQAVLGGGWNKGCFQNCTSLRFAILPSSVTTISGYDFSGCTALQTLVMRNETPCTLGSLPSNLVSIYVPDASVDTYKAATGWVSYEAKIKPMSEISSDDPTLYAEIEEYL